MPIDYDKMTRGFLLGESYENPDVFSYLQSLEEILGRLQPKTVRERRYISVAKNHLVEIRRATRRLSEEVRVLQEQVKVLEENKGK